VYLKTSISVINQIRRYCGVLLKIYPSSYSHFCIPVEAAVASYILQTFYYHTETIPEGKPPTYCAKKSEATVPARSTPQHQFDEHQTISSRYPIRRRNTTKLHRNDGRTPMSRLRFYADTYIITTYYLNSTSCFFSYVIYHICSRNFCPRVYCAP